MLFFSVTSVTPPILWFKFQSVHGRDEKCINNNIFSYPDKTDQLNNRGTTGMNRWSTIKTINKLVRDKITSGSLTLSTCSPSFLTSFTKKDNRYIKSLSNVCIVANTALGLSISNDDAHLREKCDKVVTWDSEVEITLVVFSDGSTLFDSSEITFGTENLRPNK